MGMVIVVIGLGCVIAAIVGGGVKLHNLEVGSIKSLGRQALLGLFGLIVSLIGLGMEMDGTAGGGAAFSGTGNESASDVAANALALDNGSVPETNVATDMVALAPETAVAPQPAAMATGKSLVFANACPKELSIWIVYEGANGWTSHNQAYWTVPGNERITMADRDIPLSPVSDELYYFAKTTDGSTEWSGDSSFDGLANLRKAVVTTDAKNNYLLELTC